MNSDANGGSGDQHDGRHDREAADRENEPLAAQRPVDRARRVPRAQAFEPLRERVEDAPRPPKLSAAPICRPAMA